MIKAIRHAIRVVHSALRERAKAKERSPHWNSVRDKFLEKNGACAACGSRKRLQVHHKKPFHLHPELELVETNLIALCMDVHECHLRLGHGGSFVRSDPKIESHAAQVRLRPDQRPTVEKEAMDLSLKASN